MLKPHVYLKVTQLGIIFLSLFLLVGGGVNHSSAKTTKTERITGCYSSLFYHDESGDILGYEFFIIPGPLENEYYVMFQESPGWPQKPLLVPLKVNGNSIEFTVPRDEKFNKDEMIFKGKIIPGKIVGQFNSYNEKIELKKGESYWQDLEYNSKRNNKK
ncbi:hypothetical protein [Desulfovibrio litoralis]|uniref:Uncharacterized protein n=1 Tax=Desulfovibrio litoralis DSM 11393 TaxID=1121455 RepID=A0A1M7SXZ8_9BACT|nr:hypothetical protein [Desulfovibrio litoralis]SHN63383.1 hypothetical protein SAMN02745728_01369 [Desulfovibrio litoralis DSM 11393]